MIESGPEAIVRCEQDGGAATVYLNNPPLNILTRPAKERLAKTFAALGENPEVRAIILTGVGKKAFCVGANIREFPERFDPSVAKADVTLGHTMLTAIVHAPQPTIAAIEGHCYGGGCELVIACDLRVAGEGAKFGFPEVKRGLFPGNGGTQLLPRIVGAARAKELILFGKTIEASEAARIGLINEVVAAGKALARARELAEELASSPRLAVQIIKRLVDGTFSAPFRDGLAMEKEAFLEVFRTEDVREGVAAFLEKREPRFKHR